MIYYKADENHKVTMFTKSAQIAEDYHLTETCEDDGIEKTWDGSWYIKGYAPEKPRKKELEETIKSLESQTGLIRPIREGILTENSPYSEYTKNKAKEIEDLAIELRGME